MAEEKVYDAEVMGPEEAGAPMALDVVARAEIDMAIATAKRWPRSIARVKQSMIDLATLDEETAEECYYSLKRKDASGNPVIINGPSIRMAEIALVCFQNTRVGVRSNGETPDGKFVLMQAVCHDLENNVFLSVEVPRRITTKNGRRFGDDMVGVTMAAASSIARRNAILGVIPRALVKSAYEAAREVAVGKAKSLTQRRGEVVGRLRKLSPLITDDRICFAVDKPSIEAIGWPEIELLIGLGTAIKDGGKVEEIFPDPATAGAGDHAEGASGVKPEELRKAAAAPKAAKAVAEKAKATTEAEPAADGGSQASLLGEQPAGPVVRMNDDMIQAVKEQVYEDGISLEAVEEHFGCKLHEIEGPSEMAISARVMGVVNEIKAKAAKEGDK